MFTYNDIALDDATVLGNRTVSEEVITRTVPTVGIATGYGLDGRGVGVRVPVGARFFLLCTSSRPVLGPTQPPIQWVPGVKRRGRETDHSPIRFHGIVLN
jgi:hypothetical protein